MSDKLQRWLCWHGHCVCNYGPRGQKFKEVFELVMPRGNQGGGNRNRNSEGEFTSGNSGSSRSSSGGNKGGGNSSRSEAARKGGESHSKEHMREIGRKGGQN